MLLVFVFLCTGVSTTNHRLTPLRRSWAKKGREKRKGEEKERQKKDVIATANEKREIFF